MRSSSDSSTPPDSDSPPENRRHTFLEALGFGETAFRDLDSACWEPAESETDEDLVLSSGSAFFDEVVAEDTRSRQDDWVIQPSSSRADSEERQREALEREGVLGPADIIDSSVALDPGDPLPTEASEPAETGVDADDDAKTLEDPASGAGEPVRGEGRSAAGKELGNSERVENLERSEDANSDDPERRLLVLACPECQGQLTLQSEHLGVPGTCVWCETPIVAARSGTDGEVRIFGLASGRATPGDNHVNGGENTERAARNGGRQEIRAPSEPVPEGAECGTDAAGPQTRERHDPRRSGGPTEMSPAADPVDGAALIGAEPPFSTGPDSDGGTPLEFEQAIELAPDVAIEEAPTLRVEGALGEEDRGEALPPPPPLEDEDAPRSNSVAPGVSERVYTGSGDEAEDQLAVRPRPGAPTENEGDAIASSPPPLQDDPEPVSVKSPGESHSTVEASVSEKKPSLPLTGPETIPPNGNVFQNGEPEAEPRSTDGRPRADLPPPAILPLRDEADPEGTEDSRFGNVWSGERASSPLKLPQIEPSRYNSSGHGGLGAARLSVSILIAIVGLAAGVSLATFLFPVEDYVSRVRDAVQEKFGEEIDVDADPSWPFYSPLAKQPTDLSPPPNP